ncbi:hypothetical protein SSAG_01122 [Streptomyces sp. Mg1]|nr:hypothetical protein SSAG_01122 [Streptomyces sp. Mg1]
MTATTPAAAPTTMTTCGDEALPRRVQGGRSGVVPVEARSNDQVRRRHSRLGQRSPIAYENDFQPAAIALTQAA